MSASRKLGRMERRWSADCPRQASSLIDDKSCLTAKMEIFFFRLHNLYWHISTRFTFNQLSSIKKIANFPTLHKTAKLEPTASRRAAERTKKIQQHEKL